MRRLYDLALAVIVCLAVMACDAFEYHPYDTRYSGDEDINATNIRAIEHACAECDTFSFAFMSDNHLWHKQAREIVASINSDSDIDFVIHGGDLTDCATTKEYVEARNILQSLKVPFVALLGNHDCLATGLEVYHSMFGRDNFAFIAGDVKFVCINTNALEYDYAAPVPDFSFMKLHQAADSERVRRTVVVMHVRPYSEVFNNNLCEPFQEYVRKFPGLLFCLNGHDHALQITDLFNDGVMYYGVANTEKLQYMKFTVYPNGYDYEVVDL